MPNSDVFILSDAEDLVPELIKDDAGIGDEATLTRLRAQRMKWPQEGGKGVLPDQRGDFLADDSQRRALI